MFLGWFDDTPRKSATSKIEEAVERYIAKFGEEPDLCLLNEANATEYKDLEIKVVEYVRPNHFWVGKEDALPAKAQAA